MAAPAKAAYAVVAPAQDSAQAQLLAALGGGGAAAAVVPTLAARAPAAAVPGLAAPQGMVAGLAAPLNGLPTVAGELNPNAMSAIQFAAMANMVKGMKAPTNIPIPGNGAVAGPRMPA